MVVKTQKSCHDDVDAFFCHLIIFHRKGKHPVAPWLRMNEAIAEAARKKKAGPNESMRIDMKLSLAWEFHGILWWFSLVVNGEKMYQKVGIS